MDTINKSPIVSIIIPIHNESAHIERSLMSVFAQNYPHHLLEVIIADGNSTDDTREKINQISRHFSEYRTIVIDNPDQYMPMGFNRSLRKSHGEVIIMLGGHSEIYSDYVTQCVLMLNKYPTACVGGPMETVANGWVGQAIAVALSSVFGVGGVAFRTMPNWLMEVDTVVFGAYRSQVFREIGCLDEEMIRNQDDEFNYRLREHGGRILFSPDIRSRYYSRANLASLWRQYFQYGYWKVRVLQKHPRQMSLRQFVPPAFVLALLGSIALALSPSLRILSLIVPSLYVIANITASLWIVSKRGWKYLGWLPFIFAILHLGYGLGFLVGLVKFWNCWSDKNGKVPVWSSETSG